MGMRKLGLYTSGCIATLTLFGATAAQAQSVEEFYKGKTITIVVGSEAGGGYDLNARVLSRHLARHIPGNPNILVQNKPGAGSVVATNYVYEVARQDGTFIAAVQRTVPFQAILGDSGLRADVRKIQWLGSPVNELGVVVAWQTAPQQTIDDVFKSEMIVGGVGPAADTELYPRAMNRLLGTKFRIVSGYPGQSQIALAMERGEVQGVANWSWSDIANGRTDWLRDKKIKVLLQLGLKKSPDLPNVPLILDIVKNDEQRQIFHLLMGMKALGRPYFVGPDVPKDRRDALRVAFMDTMKDPEFLEEAKRVLGTVDPTSGADTQKIVEEIYALPESVVEKARDAMKAEK